METSHEAIVGRERELSVLARFVHGLSERPHDLLLEGTAGIGKTTLWRAGVERARADGHRVLVSRPGENDTRLPYSVVGDLIGDVFDEALDEAPDPQRRALEIALMRRTADDLGPDARAIALGVREAFRALSTSSALVIAVDDVQWLDASSARAIRFALRRLAGSKVAVLASRRREGASPDPEGLIAELTDRNVVRVDVGSLDVAEVGRILRDRLDQPLAPPTVARIHAATEGNPFYLFEIARGLSDASPTAGRPLPLPGDIHDVLRVRIEGLSENARDVMLAAAAMARPSIGALRDATPEPAVADSGLAEASETGLVSVDGGRVIFEHPLLRSAVYWSASQGRRQAVHARLAETVPDIEERARHIALTGTEPDPAKASLIHDAADHARRRGAPLAAAELLTLSAELTPRDQHTQLCSRTRLAAVNAFDAGDVRGARAMLEDLIEATSSRRERAITSVELAARSYNDVDRVQDLLRAASTDCGDAFLPLVSANLAWVAIYRLDPAIGAEHARAAIELAERAPEPTPLRIALGALGRARALLGLDAEPTMRRASAIGADVGPGEAAHPSAILGQQMLWEGNIAEARRLIDEADGAYVEAGLELMRYDTLPFLSEVECASGDWAGAALHAAEGYETVVQAGLDEIRDQMLYARAHVAALMGRVDAARTDATEGVRLAAAHGNRWDEVANRSVLGFVALSEDDPAETVHVLEPAERLLTASGIVDPGVFPFMADLGEALVSLGQLDRAKQVAGLLHDQGAALNRALALATAARCRALIAAGLGDLPGALLELERAFTEHERVEIPFEAARTLLAHGDILRRMKRKREARESLDRARSRFQVLGAPLWEARTERALARIGGRPSSPTELSETEQRVAGLVSQGMTNKEAAERLFMSVKTVESNLRRIYRKLGVRSRTELAHRHRPLPQDQRAFRPRHQT